MLVMVAPVALNLMSPGEALRAEALESELNAAILEIGEEDFLLDNFDLKSLFSESLSRYYSDEVVLWLGAELTNGKHAFFQRLADVLEPVHTFLEMGMACVGLFRVLSSSQDSQGDLISECEAVLGGPYSTGAAIRWRTVRVETTGRHRRTNRGPSVGGPARDLSADKCGIPSLALGE